MPAITHTRFGIHKLTADKIRILLADDHPIVGEGIRALLAGEPELCVCHEARDAAAALVAQQQCRHHLAIVDVSLGRDSGLQLVATLKRTWPELSVLVLSIHDSQLYARDAYAAGASAYLSKQTPPQVLLLAIRRLVAGGLWRLPRTPENPSLQRLSKREREVLRLIGCGHSSAEIAGQLGRSVKTIEAHRENIKQKLGLARGKDLLRYALLWAEGKAPE